MSKQKIEPARAANLPTAPTLDQLAEHIRAEHAAVLGSEKNGLEHGKKCGDHLNKAKEMCATEGDWMTYASGAFPEIKPSTRARYMRIARRWDDIMAADPSVASLTAAAKLIAEHAAPKAKKKTIRITENDFVDLADKYDLPLDKLGRFLEELGVSLPEVDPGIFDPVDEDEEDTDDEDTNAQGLAANVAVGGAA